MIVGILLAAGAGTRFGGGKLLHPLPDGVPMGVASVRNDYNPMNIQPQSGERNNFRQPTATLASPTYPNPYGGLDPISFGKTESM